MAVLPLLLVQGAGVSPAAVRALRDSPRVHLVHRDDANAPAFFSRAARATVVATARDPVEELVYVRTSGFTGPLLLAFEPRHEDARGALRDAGVLECLTLPIMAAELDGALDLVGERTGKPPVEVLEQAVKTVTPVLEVRSRRVGGANYQVPVEVPQRRARTLAVRWIVTYARDRREKQMSDKLANEILDALNQQGGAFKRKDDLYRMAQANKAFAHYRW